MASPTQWTCVWTNSRKQWRTGKPGVLQFMVLQRVGHGLATEQTSKRLFIHLPLMSSLVAQMVKNLSAMQEIWVGLLGQKICWRSDRLPTPVFLSFPGGSGGEESVCNVGDLGSISGLGRSPGEGKGHPLQYSCLGNHRDRRTWWATVHGVAWSQIQLSN